MRIIISVVLVLSVTSLKAQTFIPGSFIDNGYRGFFANNLHSGDSRYRMKWSLINYGAISTSFGFFNGSNATIVSAPIGLQLNRRLNNNLYAFAGVSMAPTYINFNRSFIGGGYNKTGQNNTFYKPERLGVYSRAELGLQYINDERTFSISGSIGVERSSYPLLPYAPLNNAATKPIQPKR